MASSTDPNLTRKRKGGRYVPSRYKQSAEKYTSQCSDETSSGPSKISSTVLYRTKMNQTGLKKTHSTPEYAGNAPPSFDESAIPNASCISIDGSKKDRLRQTSISVKGQTHKNMSTTSSSRSRDVRKEKKSSKQDQTDLEAELDTCYAEYQLNLLLENKARKSLQDKSKFALEKIYQMFCYIQSLLGTHENIKQSLNIVNFLLELHKHSSKQENILAPCIEILDELEKQYEEISTAVNCVRNKLLVDEVMPLEGAEEEVLHLMNNIDNFLNVILTSVGNVDEIVTSADEASAFVRKGKLTFDELKRDLGLLAEARNLALSETSLKFASLSVEDQT